MSGFNGADLLRAELAQERGRVADLARRLDVASSQRTDAQVALAWLMRKHGETAIVIPQPEAKDVVESHRLRTGYSKATPDGGTEEVPVMTVELVTIPKEPTEEKPVLRIAR